METISGANQCLPAAPSFLLGSIVLRLFDGLKSSNPVDSRSRNHRRDQELRRVGAISFELGRASLIGTFYFPGESPSADFASGFESGLPGGASASSSSSTLAWMSSGITVSRHGLCA